MFDVKVIADSINRNGPRIATMQLKYPRYIHAELMTHRIFSRNASSSRAIPVGKLAQLSIDEMVTPIKWGLNQPGMQSQLEELEGDALREAKLIWENTARICAHSAEQLANLGLHKQWANRMLEWFGHISVVVTATDWDNFFALRAHPDAQPEIQYLAVLMQKAMAESTPIELRAGEWHLPYITSQDYSQSLETRLKMSTARCARVSYLKHDGGTPSVEEDLALYERLVGSMPIHASPCEHQATPIVELEDFDLQGNFSGWVQHRKVLERRFGETLG